MPSYLAQGLSQGFETGAAAYKDKKRRAFEKEQADAMQALREKQLDFEISNADRTFNRQAGRDQRDDQNADRSFYYTANVGNRDFAHTQERDKYSDTRNTERDTKADQLAADQQKLAQDRLNEDIAARKNAETFRNATQGPGSPAYATPAFQNRYYEAMANSKTPGFGTGLAADGGDETPAGKAETFGPEYEGKTLKGPDGKTYLIKNGIAELIK